MKVLSKQLLWITKCKKKNVYDISDWKIIFKPLLANRVLSFIPIKVHTADFMNKMHFKILNSMNLFNEQIYQ